ncbi:MAG: sulfotransferase [Gammaproteobacteria bacterium]|nr:sulfotransferase [Gammaproteobacteria bacterium]
MSSPHPEHQTLRDLLNRGFNLLERGDVRGAAACCQQAIAMKPDLVPAHFLVGLVALEAQDRKTAFSAFGSVTKLEPAHAAAWAHLAKLYMGEGQVNLADAALREARKVRSDDPMVNDLLGTVASLMGDYEEARELYQRAIDRSPSHPPFLLNLANNLVYHGQTGASKALFEKIIELQPDSPQAHWALAGASKATDDAHIEQMQALCGGKGRNPRALAFYYYAIGKEYEDLQQWDPAFEAFSEGARQRRMTVDYDEKAEIEMFDCLSQQFTGQWLADGSPGHESGKPIFVLGQPRSGTTLIERIISSHSQVHSAGELQHFGLAIRRLSNFQDPKRFSAGLINAAMGVDCRKIAGMYLETTRKMQGDAARFIDKLPQNYLFLPLILKALPHAKIVHLVRDPRDASFSSFKQLFADAYLHSYDQREMARHHARYWHLMQLWRERFPGRFFDMSYEATVQDLESNARALIEYLELPWEDACLSFHEQKTAVSTASAVQVREPAHTRSVGRWRRYESQLAPMLGELRAAGVEMAD